MTLGNTYQTRLTSLTKLPKDAAEASEVFLCSAPVLVAADKFILDTTRSTRCKIPYDNYSKSHVLFLLLLVLIVEHIQCVCSLQTQQVTLEVLNTTDTDLQPIGRSQESGNTHTPQYEPIRILTQTHTEEPKEVREGKNSDNKTLSY